MPVEDILNSWTDSARSYLGLDDDASAPPAYDPDEVVSPLPAAGSPEYQSPDWSAWEHQWEPPADPSGEVVNPLPAAGQEPTFDYYNTYDRPPVVQPSFTWNEQFDPEAAWVRPADVPGPVPRPEPEQLWPTYTGEPSFSWDSVWAPEPEAPSPEPARPAQHLPFMDNTGAWESVQAGMGDVAKSLSGFLKWQGWLPEQAESLEQWGTQQLAAHPVEMAKWKGWESVVDPEFYSTTIARSLPSVVPGVAAGIIAMLALPAEAGAGTVLAAGAGVAGASRLLESLQEAGSTYNEAIDRGMDERGAGDAARTTMIGNMALTPVDALQILPYVRSVSAPVRAAMRVGAAARLGPAAPGALAALGIGGEAASEGVEEVIQDAIKSVSIGDPLEWNWETFTAGALMGGGLHGGAQAGIAAYQGAIPPPGLSVQEVGPVGPERGRTPDEIRAELDAAKSDLKAVIKAVPKKPDDLTLEQYMASAPYQEWGDTQETIRAQARSLAAELAAAEAAQPTAPTPTEPTVTPPPPVSAIAESAPVTETQFGAAAPEPESTIYMQRSDLLDFADSYYAPVGPETIDLLHATVDRGELLSSGRFDSARSGTGIGRTKGEAAGTVFLTPDSNTAQGWLGRLTLAKGNGAPYADPGLVVVTVRRGSGVVEGTEVRVRPEDVVAIKPAPPPPVVVPEPLTAEESKELSELWRQYNGGILSRAGVDRMVALQHRMALADEAADKARVPLTREEKIELKGLRGRDDLTPAEVDRWLMLEQRGGDRVTDWPIEVDEAIPEGLSGNVILVLGKGLWKAVDKKTIGNARVDLAYELDKPSTPASDVETLKAHPVQWVREAAEIASGNRRKEAPLSAVAQPAGAAPPPVPPAPPVTFEDLAAPQPEGEPAPPTRVPPYTFDRVSQFPPEELIAQATVAPIHEGGRDWKIFLPSGEGGRTLSEQVGITVPKDAPQPVTPEQVLRYFHRMRTLRDIREQEKADIVGREPQARVPDTVRALYLNEKGKPKPVTWEDIEALPPPPLTRGKDKPKPLPVPKLTEEPAAVERGAAAPPPPTPPTGEAAGGGAVPPGPPTGEVPGVPQEPGIPAPPETWVDKARTAATVGGIVMGAGVAASVIADALAGAADEVERKKKGLPTDVASAVLRAPKTGLDIVFNVLSRTNWAAAGGASELGRIVRGEKEGDANSVTAAFYRGLTAQERKVFADVLKEAGMPEVASYVLGFGLDVVADPLNLISGAGALKLVSRGQKALNRLPYVPDITHLFGVTFIQNFAVRAKGWEKFADDLETLYRIPGIQSENAVKVVRDHLGSLNDAQRYEFFRLADEGLATIREGATKEEIIDQAVRNTYEWYTGEYRPPFERIKESMGLKSFLSEYIRHVFPEKLRKVATPHPVQEVKPGSFRERKGVEGYSHDPMLAIAYDRAEVMTARAINAFVHDVLINYGIKLGKDQKAPPDRIEYFPKGKLGFYPVVHPETGDLLAVGVKEGTRYAVPTEIGQALNAFLNPKETTGWLHLFDMVQGVWKGAVTSLFPEFHLRNAMGNVFNNWLGGVYTVGPYMDAAAVQNAMRGMTGSVRRRAEEAVARTGLSVEDFYQILRERGVVNTGFYGRDVLDALEATTGATRMETALRGAKGGAMAGLGLGTLAAGPLGAGVGAAVGAPAGAVLSVLSQIGRIPGEAIENNAKIAHVLGRMARGDTLDQAIASARKYLFDYGNLTDIERGFLRRVVPFFVWSRFNVPLMLEAIVGQPQKVIGVEKLRRAAEGTALAATGTAPLTAEERDLMPEYVQEQLSIQVGRDENDNPILINGIGLPIEDLNQLFRITPARTLMRWFSQATPILRNPLEYISNWSAFTGRQVREIASRNYYMRTYEIVSKVPALAEWLQLKPVNVTTKDGSIRTDYTANPERNYIFLAVLGRVVSTLGKVTGPEGVDVADVVLPGKQRVVYIDRTELEKRTEQTTELDEEGKPKPKAALDTIKMPPGLDVGSSYEAYGRWQDQMEPYWRIGDKRVAGKSVREWEQELYDLPEEMQDAWRNAHPEQNEAIRQASKERTTFKANPNNAFATGYLEMLKLEGYDTGREISKRTDTTAFERYYQYLAWEAPLGKAAPKLALEGAPPTGKVATSTVGTGRSPELPGTAAASAGVPGVTLYYQTKNALEQRISDYYEFGDAPTQELVARYGAMNTDDRAAFRKASPGEYAQIKAYYEARDKLLEEPDNAILAEYLQFLDDVGGRDRRDAIEKALGMSSVEWFLQARSIGLTKPRGVTPPAGAAIPAEKATTTAKTTTTTAKSTTTAKATTSAAPKASTTSTEYVNRYIPGVGWRRVKVGSAAAKTTTTTKAATTATKAKTAGRTRLDRLQDRMAGRLEVPYALGRQPFNPDLFKKGKQATPLAPVGRQPFNPDLFKKKTTAPKVEAKEPSPTPAKAPATTKRRTRLDRLRERYPDMESRATARR